MRQACRGSAHGLLVLLSFLLVPALASAQGGEQNGPPPINAATDPLLRGFEWRAIGPIGQGGRVDDIEVVEGNPSTFYVGFATGGLWKTTNNGTTFESIFDTYSTHSIGDIAIAPSNPDIVYVGTGEPNNRQSSSFGNGVYRTTDGGRSFTRVGLEETQSIGRVIVHPTNPDIAWVAAVGHLYGPNPERGVFKTTDGGSSWRKVLFVDNSTGATDLVIDPVNPNYLLAATYQRQRTAWGFAASGEGSGIWRSEDGGENWTRLAGDGLPAGSLGRIALSFSRSNPNVVYAQMEVAPDREPVDPEAAGRGGRGGGFGGGQDQPPDPNYHGVWRSADKGRTWEFRSNQNVRPMYFSQIRVDPNDENTVYVGGVDGYKSTDGARTWIEMDNHGHVDHHAIWIDPDNSQHVIYGNDGGLDVSYDGGETWESIRLWAVGQPYHVSVDMRRPYFACTGLQDNGTWCGPSSVRTGSILSQDWYGVGGGDGFYTAIDPRDWAIVYSESQNGNTNRYNLRTGENQSIRPRTPGGRGGGRGGNAPSNIVPTPEDGIQLRHNWSTPFILSPHNPDVIHLGSNRLHTSYNRGDTWSMSEDLTKNRDREALSIMDLPGDMPGCGRARVGACIHSKNDGVNVWGTIVSIAESPIVQGLLWVGTDDGNVQVSRDGGQTWTEVGRNVPGGTKEYYISRVEASYFDPATAYISVDGHRHDDLRPYVYLTRDYGQTWTSISSDLPAMGNVNTVRQDPRNPDLLYAGTEFGFFVSLDEGASWKRFMTNLPVVRIDDVLVHPRDNDLVLATHGRSIQVMDDITALQQLTPDVMAQPWHLMQPRDVVLWKNDRRLSRPVTGQKVFEGDAAPDGAFISYHLGSVPSGEFRLTVTNMSTGELFRTIEDAPRHEGLNRIEWDLCSDRRPVDPQAGGGRGGFGGFGGGCGGGGRGGQQGPPMIATRATPGVYRVTLTIGGRSQSVSLNVLEDIWMHDK